MNNENINVKFQDKYEELYYRYLEAKDGYWDGATYNSESSKLKTIVRVLRKSGLRGISFYQELKAEGYKPYTIKSLTQRAASMYEWAIKNQVASTHTNPFADLLVSSPHLFRNAYKAERLKLDFDEAAQRIMSIPQENVRECCLSMLRSGLRIHEVFIVNKETNSVIGKGNKERFTVWAFPAHLQLPSAAQVRYALKKIGLKPHSLRKLLATKLARSDMRHMDIMALMGWSSMETATKYIQPMNEDKLKSKLEEILK